MRVSIFFLSFLMLALYHGPVSLAQPGIIHTIAGGGTSLAEGVPATNAKFTTAAGLCTDCRGNIYIADEQGYKIRRVSAANGIISTVAGTGIPGTAGDGGPATNAQIGTVRSIAVDANNNIYLADYGNNRIRKIDAITGIITTVAGGGTSNADGVPATNASLAFLGIEVDRAGNIYTYGNARIRKVDAATGKINTIAGGGTSSAEGIPATAAVITQPRWMVCDSAGDLFLLNGAGDYIRKIDAATGNINTIAGGGTSLTDGGPATAFSFLDLHSFSLDPAHNLVIMDRTNGVVRKVNMKTGIMNIIYGGGTSKAEGVPATGANLIDYHWVHIDLAGNIYLTNWNYGISYARQINNYPFKKWGVGEVEDSISVHANRLCNGPELMVRSFTYSADMTIQTDFGDGTVVVSPLLPGFLYGGYAIVHHSYKASGTYNITQVLFRADASVDTLITPYVYNFCRSLPVKIYFEANGNGIKDAGESFMSEPSAARVDSNGTPVDTISATSGFNYSAYCTPGSVYSFQLISMPGRGLVGFPPTGILSDTVLATTLVYPDKYFGITCISSLTCDMRLNTVIHNTTINSQTGSIFLRNKSCLAAGGTVTLHFSPKWVFDTAAAKPAALSFSGTSATWAVGSIALDNSRPLEFYYKLKPKPTTGNLPIGDTVHSYFVVAPYTTDTDLTNNDNYRVDTVRAGVDPNNILVTPRGNILPCTELEYTINFENTGNDTAHNIYVLDTLPSNVDPGSMRIVMASAFMNLSILKEGPYTIARFDFPNINLPDSSHRDACHGSVIYTIKSKSGLADGTLINNRAGIYFDINEVVMTNTATNTIGMLPIAGKGSLCVGTKDTLVNTMAGGVWTASNANATVVNGVVTGVAAGLDTISYTVSNACTSQTKTKVVTIGSTYPGPIVGTPEACNGTIAFLSHPLPGGLWKSTNPLVASVAAGYVTSKAVGTTTISYTVTHACGTGTATVTFNVNPLPWIFPVSGGGSICTGGPGSPVSISSSEPGINYQLYNGITMVGPAVPGTGSALSAGMAATAGTYSIKAENPVTACTKDMSGFAVFTETPSFPPAVFISYDADTVCAGTTVTYIATPSYGGSSPVYRWTVNGINTGITSATYAYTPAPGDVITALLKSSETCAIPDTAVRTFAATIIASAIPTIVVTATPGTNISKGESITLTAAVTDAGATPTYRWIVNGKTIFGATMPTYTYDQFADNDSVACLVTSSGECGGHTSFNGTIIHVSTVGVRTVGNSTISIYPNPVSDELTINTGKQYSSFTITNSIGQVMMEQPLSGGQTEVNVKALAAGLYYITLRGSEGVTVQKFVKL